jgi:nucleoside-diphosphate-sugar epimerase
MDAYMLAIKENKSLELNVGTEDFGTLKDALQNLIKSANSDSKVLHLPVLPTITGLKVADKLRISPLAPWHYLTYHKPFYFDLEPLKEIGWSSRYSNDEMLSEAFHTFREQKFMIAQSESPHRKAISGGVLNLLKRFS